MPVQNFCDYFHPCSTKFHVVEDFKKLNKKQRAAAVFAAIGGAIASLPILGLGGIAAFRRVVKNFSEDSSSSTEDKTAATFKATKGRSKKSEKESTRNSSQTASSATEEEEPVVDHKRYLAAIIRGINSLDEKKVSKQEKDLVIQALKECFASDITSEEDFEVKRGALKDKLVPLVNNAVKKTDPYVTRAFAIYVLKYVLEIYEEAYKFEKEQAILSGMKVVDNARLKSLAAILPEISNTGKRAQYIQAINLFEKFNCKEKIRPGHFNDDGVKSFQLDAKHRPSYFSTPFQNNDILVAYNKGYYDYKPLGTNGEIEFFVDFANRVLGGGIDDGYVQEEKMVAEMPNLMNYIARNKPKNKPCSIRVRDGKDSVYGGSPNPRIFQNCVRVQALEGYGRVPSIHKFKETAKPLAAPQVVNVLAMAAPRLPSKSPAHQLDIKTAEDLFNTITAGFTLAAKRGKANRVIVHTGQLGCGVFKNNVMLVFLLQVLVAKQKNVDIVLYDCNDANYAKLNALWAEIEPQLQGKKLEECVKIIVDTLKSKLPPKRPAPKPPKSSSEESKTDLSSTDLT